MRLLAHFFNKERAGFAELCKSAGYLTDLGGYYIRQLASSGYIEKVGRGEYQLLPKGKQELAINYGRRMTQPRPRVAALVIANRQGTYAVMQRAVQPFIGAVEWPAGMVIGGEELTHAAKRIAKDRLGVDVEPEHKGFFRRVDMLESTVFDDKLFAVHTCEIPPHIEFIPEAKPGKIHTYTVDELQKLDTPSRSLIDILEFAHTDNTAYVEKMYQLNTTDLSL